jgi:hypothetical protein
VLPEFQISGGLTAKTDYYFQFEAQTYWLESTAGETRSELLVRNLNFNSGISRDLGTDWNFAASFLVRSRQPFEEKPGWELRPRVQLTHVYRRGKYRFRNRLRADNRFEQRKKGDRWEFDLRLRYRLSMDFPLQGERLDDGEFYLNSSAELALTVTQADFWFYRNPRGYSGLGYRLNDKNKLETGIEYRTENDNEAGDDEHVVFWRMVWVRSI